LIKIIEYLVGNENFRNFKDFITQGGLETILSRNNIQEERKDYIKHGTITIIKTKRGIG
jgi:predicted N-acyltransferase